MKASWAKTHLLAHFIHPPRGPITPPPPHAHTRCHAAKWARASVILNSRALTLCCGVGCLRLGLAPRVTHCTVDPTRRLLPQRYPLMPRRVNRPPPWPLHAVHDGTVRRLALR
jgi:hypothetical protein